MKPFPLHFHQFFTTNLLKGEGEGEVDLLRARSKNLCIAQVALLLRSFILLISYSHVVVFEFVWLILEPLVKQ